MQKSRHPTRALESLVHPTSRSLPPKETRQDSVVFDCSAKYKGISLNDHLLTGPDFTNGLTAVLCCFRKHPFAVMCDVDFFSQRFHVSKED
jgi:uncharacterized protein YcfL